MKKLILSILIFTVFYFPTKAQTSYEDILELKSQTINVVLNDDKVDSFKYNPAIKDAVEKYWTFCKYKFITLDEYQKNSQNEEMIFLLPVRFISNNITSDEFVIRRGHENGILGKNYNIFYTYFEPVASIRMPFESGKLYYFFEKDNKKQYQGFPAYFLANKRECREMLPNIIQLWQWENETIVNHPELAGKKPLEVTSFLVSQHDIKQLKTKTLYIDENSFAVLTSTSISTIYKYEFKIVPTDTIFKIIKEQNENICYLYNGGQAKDGSFPIAVYEAKGGYRLFAPKDNHYVSFNGTSKAKHSEEYFTELMAAIEK